MGQDGSTNFPSASVSWGLEWSCLGSSYNCVMTDEILSLSSRMRRWWALIVIIFDLQKEQVIKPQGHLANRHIIHQELSKASCYGHDSHFSALLLALVWLNRWGQNQHNQNCPQTVPMSAPGINPPSDLCCTTGPSELLAPVNLNLSIQEDETLLLVIPLTYSHGRGCKYRNQSSPPRFFSLAISKTQIHGLLGIHCCLVTKLSMTLCNPLDCSPPGSSVHRIPQAGILEWAAISFSRRSSWPRDQTQVSCFTVRFFTTEPPGKPYLDSKESL